MSRMAVAKRMRRGGQSRLRNTTQATRLTDLTWTVVPDPKIHEGSGVLGSTQMYPGVPGRAHVEPWCTLVHPGTHGPIGISMKP